MEKETRLSWQSQKCLEQLDHLLENGPMILTCGICTNLSKMPEAEYFVTVMSEGWRGQPGPDSDPLAPYLGLYRQGRDSDRWRGEAGYLRRELLAHIKAKVLAGDWDKDLLAHGHLLIFSEATNHDD